MIASITGNLQAVRHPGDHLLHHWREAGLLRPSLVQAKSPPLRTRLSHVKLGRLSRDDVTELDRGLREALGLS
jgi:hypothetical protein